MTGIYCLIIKIKEDINIKIGALGRKQFTKGKYVYVGSAQNNLEKRVSRHLSINKKMHWHIDFLLAYPDVAIEKVFYRNTSKEQECKTASLLSQCEKPVQNFGSSDCRCKTHLFRINSLKQIKNSGFKKLMTLISEKK